MAHDRGATLLEKEVVAVHNRVRVFNVVAIVVVTMLSLVGSSSAAQNVASSATAWGFAAKSAGPATAPIYQVMSNVRGTSSGSTTPQGHYDRVVFDTISATNSQRVGYSVHYVSQLRADGSGEMLPLSGAFKLSVVIRAPAYNDSGQATYRASVGRNLPGVSSGMRVVDSVYGGSFEGLTSFGLGLNGKQRFRVVQLPDGRVAVDILR